MSTNHHTKPFNSFVQTITIGKQPYLLYGEQQDENNYIITCRNTEIPPLHFVRTGNGGWETPETLSGTLQEIGQRIDEILNGPNTNI